MDALFGDRDVSLSSDDHLATGKTAYQQSDRFRRLRERREAIVQLTLELERPPTAEEIELCFAEEEEAPARITIEGGYGRDLEEESPLETRKAERGPTTRRI